MHVSDSKLLLKNYLCWEGMMKMSCWPQAEPLIILTSLTFFLILLNWLLESLSLMTISCLRVQILSEQNKFIKANSIYIWSHMLLVSRLQALWKYLCEETSHLICSIWRMNGFKRSNVTQTTNTTVSTSRSKSKSVLVQTFKFHLKNK